MTLELSEQSCPEGQTNLKSSHSAATSPFLMIFWDCFHCSLTQVPFWESHKGFVKSLCYTIPALTDILIPPPTHEKSKNTATRRSRLVDMDDLPMMHCKFNISSSALLHQSQTISRLAWSAQSKRSLHGGSRLVSSSLLTFTHRQNTNFTCC